MHSMMDTKTCVDPVHTAVTSPAGPHCSAPYVPVLRLAIDTGMLLDAPHEAADKAVVSAPLERQQSQFSAALRECDSMRRDTSADARTFAAKGPALNALHSTTDTMASVCSLQRANPSLIDPHCTLPEAPLVQPAIETALLPAAPHSVAVTIAGVAPDRQQSQFPAATLRCSITASYAGLLRCALVAAHASTSHIATVHSGALVMTRPMGFHGSL